MMTAERRTAAQKVRWLVLAAHAALNDGEVYDFHALAGSEIDDAYYQLADQGDHWDAESEVREGKAETGISTPYDRHYESKSVAAPLPDGSWVGWTYWYGGGKHGNPEEMDWIDFAYDLTCSEEEKVVVIKTFSKVEVSA